MYIKLTQVFLLTIITIWVVTPNSTGFLFTFENILAATLITTKFEDIIDDLSCHMYCGGNRLICFCDRECVKYGDCCFDYWKECNVTMNSNQSDEILNEINDLVLRNRNKSHDFITLFDYDNPVEGKYYVGYKALVINDCENDDLNFTVYKNLCSGENDSNKQDTSQECVPVFDEDSGKIFKNRYYAKCNGKSDELIQSLDFLYECDPEYDFNFNNENELTFENLSKSCDIIYRKLGVSLNFRSTDVIKEDWLTCERNNSIDLINKLNFVFNRTNQSVDTTSVTSKICNIYVMPVKMTVTNLSNEAVKYTINYRNIHCFQCWIERNSFSIELLNNSSNNTILECVLSNHRVSIQFIEPETHSHQLLAVSKKISTFEAGWFSFNERYSLYETIKSYLSSKDDEFIVKNVSNVLKLIDSKYRDDDDYITTSYLKSQIEYEVSLPNQVNEYNFTWLLGFKIDSKMLNAIETVNSSLLDIVIKRFDLSSYMLRSPEYSLSVEGDSQILNVTINLRFSIKNVQLLNRKLYAILFIIKDIYLRNYEIFTSYNDTVVLPATIYKNTPNTGSFKWLPSYEYPYMDYSVETINEVIDFRTFSYKKVNDRTKFYDVRVNSVTGALPINIDKDKYQNLVHFSYSVNIFDPNYSIRMKFGFHNSIENDVISIENRQQNCEINHQLFYFNDSFRIAHITEQNELHISYMYSQVNYEIHLLNFQNLSSQVYLICANTSEAQANLTQLIDILRINNDKIESVSDKPPSSNNKSIIIIVLCVLLSIVILIIVVVILSRKFCRAKQITTNQSLEMITRDYALEDQLL